MEHRLFRRGGMAWPGPALVCLTLACLIVLAGCGAATATAGQPSGSEQPIAYDTHPGHILVQLFPAPGFIYPSVNGVPTWTLYGDGTLVYATGASVKGVPPLSQEKLSPEQVQHVLDVVVNQYAFFASDKPTYGHMVPDTGSTLLIVNAASQSKTVALYGQEGSSPDTQTKNVFAIENFLLGYHPASAQPYHMEGVALLVYPAPAGLQTTAVANWPLSSVDLASTEMEECPYLQGEKNCSQVATGQSGILPLYGPIGTTLLSQLGGQAPVSQHGVTYLVIIWPLMPDVPPQGAHPATGNTQMGHIRVATGGQIVEWPLLTETGVPTGA